MPVAQRPEIAAYGNARSNTSERLQTPSRVIRQAPRGGADQSTRALGFLGHQQRGSFFYNRFLPFQPVDPRFQLLDLLLLDGQRLARWRSTATF